MLFKKRKWAIPTIAFQRPFAANKRALEVLKEVGFAGTDVESAFRKHDRECQTPWDRAFINLAEIDRTKIEKAIAILLSDPERTVPASLAEITLLSETQMEGLSKDPDFLVRLQLARNFSCPLRLQEKLARDEPRVQQELARANIPEQIQAHLCESDDLFTRISLATNYATTWRTRRKLARDPDYYVRWNLQHNNRSMLLIRFRAYILEVDPDLRFLAKNGIKTALGYWHYREFRYRVGMRLALRRLHSKSI